MIDCSHDPVERRGARWKAVGRGLRLANSYLGTVLIAWFYASWALIGLILCLVFIPMAIMGKSPPGVDPSERVYIRAPLCRLLGRAPERGSHFRRPALELIQTLCWKTSI